MTIKHVLRNERTLKNHGKKIHILSLTYSLSTIRHEARQRHRTHALSLDNTQLQEMENDQVDFRIHIFGCHPHIYHT